MKIYQITQAKSYNQYKNTHRQNSVNNAMSSPNQNNQNCSFKGVNEFASSTQKNAKKVVNQVLDSVFTTADKVQKKVNHIYNKILDKSTKSLKPKKAEKQVEPIAIKTADSIIPQPNFSMDYDRVLSDLEKIETIDKKWVKNNTPALKAAFGYKDAEMSDHFFDIQVSEINRDRSKYIQAVKEFQTDEKAKYINKIWDEFLDVNPPFKPVNKEKNILGLQALQKYGTRDDLLKLDVNYQLSKDSDIMKEYAKLIGKVGKVDDCLKILPYASINSSKTYSENTISEIMKTLKKLMVDKAEPNHWINFEYAQYVQFEKLTNHTNKDISDNAKAITKRLVDDNPWMLE